VKALEAGVFPLAMRTSGESGLAPSQWESLQPGAGRPGLKSHFLGLSFSNWKTKITPPVWYTRMAGCGTN
jgi:hypothetical protein